MWKVIWLVIVFVAGAWAVPVYAQNPPRLPGLRLNESFNTFYIEQRKIATALEHSGQFDAALLIYRRLLNIPAMDSEERAILYGRISQNFEHKGDYQQAIEAYRKALQHSPNEIISAGLKLNAVMMYINLHYYDEASVMIEECLNTYRVKGNMFAVALAQGVKGELYKQQGKYHESIATMAEGYSYLAKQTPDHYRDSALFINVMSNRNALLNNMADAYLKLHMADSALYYLNKIQPEIEYVSESAKAGIYTSYAEAHTLLRHGDLALPYYQEALAIAEAADMHTVRQTAYKGLSLLYAQQGNYQKAWQYERNYVALHTKQLSNDNRNRVSQLQTRYLLEKKDKEMAKKELANNKTQLQLRQRNNRLILSILAVGLSTLIVAVFLRNYYNRNLFLKERLRNAAQENLINQIDATLKGEENERKRMAQELHDSVVSELMALQVNLEDMEHHYPELQKSERYHNLLYQAEVASDQLRRSAHNMLPARLKEHGLSYTLESFVKRFNNHKLRIRFQCYGQKVKLQDHIEKILLSVTQELVHNVVKHAKANEALVQLNYYEDSLGLTVEDNGVGIGQAYQNKVGMGWSNIEKNITLIGGHVDVKSSEHEGTTILIEWKIETGILYA